MPPFLRTAAESDTDSLYEICVRTADAGQDARGKFSDDRLWGDLFAVPYQVLCPDHAHVLDDGDGRAVGYVVGAPDSAAFSTLLRERWLPATEGRIPLPPEPPATFEDNMRALHHHPEWRIEPAVAAYPAHLHIDLLPEWQGHGYGRALMARLVDGLRADGVSGVHLAMVSTNVNARAFYDRLGFSEIEVPNADTLTYLVRDTSPLT